MSDPLRWPDAALAGLACSMRTTAGPAMLAAHGRITGRPRIAVLVAATGELGVDKSSVATARTDLPALAGRIASGAWTGREVAAVPGAAAGAVAAFLGTFACIRARALVVDATGLPDPVVAIGEDVVAYGIAAIGTRDDADAQDDADDDARNVAGSTAAPGSTAPPEAQKGSWLRDAGVGLLAGLGGTVVMNIAQGAEFMLTDAEPSDSPAQVADQLKRRLGRGRLKRRHRRIANQGMHWLYGASWGIPYGIVARRSKVAPELSGPIFGLLVWGAALAHEPALGLADVPWRRSLQSLGSEALFHVAYGIGAGATLRALGDRG